MRKYTIAETFVGAGGSHLGFKQAGFKSIYVDDFDQNFLKTLVNNNPELIADHTFVDGRNILDIDPESILAKTHTKPGDLDVLFVGIVCKGFSLAGDKSPNDERNYFYRKQLEFVKVLQPKISIIENVVGILHGEVLSDQTPQNIRQEVDYIWQELANYKGQKADLRKKGAITPEFENLGKQIKANRQTMMNELKKDGYLIPVLKDIYNLYEKLGYKVQHKVLNAAWYGAATKRERVVIVAVRNDINVKFKFPLPEYWNKNIRTKLDFDPKLLSTKKFNPPVTVNDALSTIDYNKKDVDNEPMHHDAKTVERFKYIPVGDSIANHIDKLPQHLVISKFYSRGNTMRLDGNQPSPTLVPGHSNFPVHPTEHRSITVREAATITGFPLDYNFVGNHTKRCEQVGNAVPPPLAKAIAKQAKLVLDQYYLQNHQ